MPEDTNKLTKEELEKLILDPNARPYFHGSNELFRTIIQYCISFADFVNKEITKENVDKEKIHTAASDSQNKMLNLLGSISDQEQLIRDLEDDDSTYSVNISDCVKKIIDKSSSVLAPRINITKNEDNIEPDIYAITNRVSIEIASADFIDYVISAGKRPDTITVTLKKLDDSFARLTISGNADGKYPIPPVTEVENSLYTKEFADIFVEQLTKHMGGELRRTKGAHGTSIVFTFKTSPKNIPLVFARETQFEFDNNRFSPAVTKLSKYR
jgi:hypothetical protein